jgi:ElaB/YqjD/DUF883 family membrane-anchored ribosome-binding protein
VIERRSASAGSEWDADVLPGDDTATQMTTAADLSAGADNDDPTAGDQDVEALVVEIEETRTEMAGTVEELGDRLDPANVAARAKETVRDATIGTLERKVDDVTTTASEFASDAGRTAQQAGSGIVETIKQNPIPAALAGIGIGWLVLNRRSGQSSNWSGSWQSSARNWDRDEIRGGIGRGSNAGRDGSGLTDTIGQRAGEAGDAIGDAASNARRAANDAMTNVGDTAGQAASTVGRTANDVMSQAQQAVESNPLAFGAIAVAVGAAVGMALPATDAEKRVMGQPASQLIDKVENAVSEPLERMETAGTR